VPTLPRRTATNDTTVTQTATATVCNCKQANDYNSTTSELMSIVLRKKTLKLETTNNGMSDATRKPTTK